VDLAPMPDYAAWGPDGSLYVTDYQQAVIWRVPPGGGAARVWLADRRLDGGPFGTACVTMLPDHRSLLFDQASNGGLGGLNPTTGKLYAVTIEPGDRPGVLRRLWESGPADAPDGCAVARSGDVYLALVGLSNQIVELSPAGTEIARFGQQYTGGNNSPVPFDSPSGVAFLGTQLIIANQSYFADNHANQAVLALETGEAGQPVYVSANAGSKTAPAQHKRKRAQHRRHRAGRHPARRAPPAFTG
jgi:sugar lactone lactonase YvrE